jgi:hypothetical protein
MYLDFNDEIKEYQLQYMWSRIVKGTEFKTVTGLSIRITNPGVWNKEEGPDFKNAVIEVDGVIKTGDIEVHLNSNAWEQHGHQNDCNYSNVILHIVKKYQHKDFYHKIGYKIPTIELPYGIISEFTAKNKDKYPKGYCAELFNKLSEKKIEQLFEYAGIERFKRKAEKLADYILKYGVNHAFLLCLFDALGYKKNRTQFAELLKRVSKHDLNALDNVEVNSILWGESGLLPDPTQFTSNDDYMVEFIKRNWHIWWRLRKNNIENISWNLSGVRPQNNPCRRIAAAQILIKRFSISSGFSKLLALFMNIDNYETTWKVLKPHLICHDNLWDNYSGFDTKLKTKSAILGESRALDILVNVILPLIYGYGLIHKKQLLMNNAVEAYLSLPAGQNNIIIEMSSERWLMPKERIKNVAKSTAAQQGIIYIYRNYCEVLSMDCSNCSVYNSI